MLKAKNFEWWSIFAELSRIFYQKYLKEYWLKLIIGKYSIIRLFLEGVIDTKLPFWGNFEFTLTSTENQGEKSCEIHIQQTRPVTSPKFQVFWPFGLYSYRTIFLTLSGYFWWCQKIYYGKSFKLFQLATVLGWEKGSLRRSCVYELWFFWVFKRKI